MLFFGGFAINVTISGYTIYQRQHCHPYSDMNATNLTEAKEECLRDQSCYMFYEPCHYSEQTSSFTSTAPPQTSDFTSTAPTQTSNFPSTTSPQTSNFPSTTSPQAIKYSGFRKCNHPVKTPYDEHSNCVLYKKGNIYKCIYIHINIYHIILV